MLRKFALGLVAAGSLGIATFAPQVASAHDLHRGHNGFGMHRSWHDAQAAFRHRHGCIQQRLVKTPWGMRLRTVNVCR